MVTYSPSAITGFGSILSFGDIDAQHYLIEKDIFLKLKEHATSLGFDLAILANAYSEKKELQKLYERYDEFEIYADSGGLQALTLGKNLDSEKPEIFKTQSMYSDWAMCFDEMPIKQVGERAEGAHTRLDQSGRYYLLDQVTPKGILTGKNIQEQIDIFKNLNSKARVMAIIQGYGVEEMEEYAKAVYSSINPDDYDWIGGLAIANTTGPGPFNLIDRIASYQYTMDFIPEAHKKHIHILAAGGPSKLIGALGFPKEFWKYDHKDFIINADATSHSSSSVFGKFTTLTPEGLTQLQTGKEFNKTSKLLLEHIFDFVIPIFRKHNLDMSFEEFRDTYSIFSTHKQTLRKHFKEDCEIDNIRYKKIIHGGRFLWMVHELKIFFNILKLMEMGKFGMVFNNSKYIKTCDILRKCSSFDDYQAIKPIIRRMLYNEACPTAESEELVLFKKEIFDLF